MKRVSTAVVAAALAVAALLLLDSAWVFVLLVALALGEGTELILLARRVHPQTPLLPFLMLVAAAATAWLAAWPPFPILPLILVSGAPLLFAVLALPRAGGDRGAVGSVGWQSFGLPYLVLPVWSLFELHRMDPGLLLLFLASIWANDSAAFLVGSRWGRHKLAPRLSPGKTWEGAVAGLVAAAAVSLATIWWVNEEPRWRLWALFVAAAVAAQVGDLVASMLKRAAAVKDSGRLLPGHGGLLDRLDAIILAAPVFYLLLGLLGLSPDL